MWLVSSSTGRRRTRRLVMIAAASVSAWIETVATSRVTRDTGMSARWPSPSSWIARSLDSAICSSRGDLRPCDSDFGACTLELRGEFSCLMV
jgi:hypothetical protein